MKTTVTLTTLEINDLLRCLKLRTEDLSESEDAEADRLDALAEKLRSAPFD
ncbi:MAG: hypothetical protein VXW22_02290 [Pseudomonadota bacterium]|nr:hypothetical protein [Pseudomonadota bacterium]